ncbi:hypothetical protein IMCC3317_43720 [Kordia antarctica]|uniref:Uncharacterized protein n=1 Tax=Kordia antarctica TaxID=1218801 RepID=A0A7L4ZQV2_9FLAO|nr:hypothetical protein [Kordia antarctica]QHI38972.1 hypothetical protein IMCC3317_43720 [Kordia antarctica]
MKKVYSIFLKNIKIGTTFLEKADAPMGVVFGEITFLSDHFGYDYFKKFCNEHAIELVCDDPEEKFLDTSTIKNLIVKSEENTEIIGIGNQITGSDQLAFEISIYGISYPFYEEEFSHHVKAYHEQFK